MISSVLLPLSPNRQQEAMFWRCAGVARWAYNWALVTTKSEYEATKKHPSAYDLIKRITTLKRTEQFKWLCEVSKQVPQYAIHNLDAAFWAFLHGLKVGRKVGYPKLKKRWRCKPAFAFGDTPDLSNCVRGRKIMLPCIGPVRIAERHPRIPEGRPLRITISRTGGRWWAAICYEVADVKVEPNGQPSVGVDLGLSHFAVLSTGEKIESPKPLRKAQRRLKRLHRSLSSSHKTSRRRERKRRVLALAHARVRNIRQTFLHRLTARLAKNHGQVVIEDLAIRNMMGNRHLAFAIGDSGWGEFRRQLEYKCPRHGSVLVIAGRWFASSKQCSSCGHKVESLPLKIREWVCQACGVRHDRDVNAAVNLKQLGQTLPEVTRVEIGDQGPAMVPVPVSETRSIGGYGRQLRLAF